MFHRDPTHFRDCGSFVSVLLTKIDSGCCSSLENCTKPNAASVPAFAPSPFDLLVLPQCGVAASVLVRYRVSVPSPFLSMLRSTGSCCTSRFVCLCSMRLLLGPKFSSGFLQIFCLTLAFV